MDKTSGQLKIRRNLPIDILNNLTNPLNLSFGFAVKQHFLPLLYMVDQFLQSFFVSSPDRSCLVLKPLHTSNINLKQIIWLCCSEPADMQLRKLRNRIIDISPAIKSSCIFSTLAKYIRYFLDIGRLFKNYNGILRQNGYKKFSLVLHRAADHRNNFNSPYLSNRPLRIKVYFADTLNSVTKKFDPYRLSYI